jgi:hypothetical protein
MFDQMGFSVRRLLKMQSYFARLAMTKKQRATLSKLRKRRDERRFIWASEKNRACAAADFRNRQRLKNSQ